MRAAWFNVCEGASPKFYFKKEFKKDFGVFITAKRYASHNSYFLLLISFFLL